MAREPCFPPAWEVSDRFVWSQAGIDDCNTQGAYPAVCLSEIYDLQALYPGSTGYGTALNWRGGTNFNWGFFGHAPFTSGALNANGGAALAGDVTIRAFGAPSAPILSCSNSGTGSSYGPYFLVAHDWHTGATLASNGASITCPNAPSSTNPITIATPAGQISTVAVSAGGSGYAVGNEVGIGLSMFEGNASMAVLTINSVNGSGAVTGLAITNSGYGYTSSTGLATFAITGSGSGLTLNITTIPTTDGVASWDILKGDTAHSIFTASRCSLNAPCQDTGQSTSAYTAPARDSSGDLALSGQLTLAALTGSTQCLQVSSTGVVSGTGTACGPSIQTNGMNNASQTTLNFQTSTTNSAGLTVTPSNPSSGTEEFEITGNNYTGNAATASALATSPTQCGLNEFATGIAASGNANCAHRAYTIDIQECDSAGMYCASGSSTTTTTSGSTTSGATSVTLASAASFSAGQGILIAGGGSVSVVGGTVAYSSGGTASGTGTCIASAANGGGADAVGSFAVSSGTISGNLTIVSGGQSYTSVPTSWTLSTGTATSCSGTVTTTGGTLVASAYIGIVSAVGGSTLTITPATATTVSSGALVEHDETNAFQSAITALAVTGGKIIVPDGFYRVNGPFQDTAGANAILNLPKIAVPVVPNTVVPVSIDIEGLTAPSNSTYAGVATNGAIIQTSATAGNFIGGLDTASYYTNLTLVFLTLKNLTFRASNNPDIDMVNAYRLGGFTGENLQFDVGVSGVPTQPKYPNGVAVTMPSAGSWTTAILRDTQITGYYTAVQAFDHNYLDNVGAFLCLRAVQMNTAGAAAYREVVVTKLLIQDCTYGIVAGNSQNILIYDLSDEAVFYLSPPSGWSSPVALFYDPSNLLSGSVNYSIIGGQSRLIATGAILQNGAGGLALNYLPSGGFTQVPPLGNLTGWVAESFDAANCTSTGSASSYSTTSITQSGQVLTLTPIAPQSTFSGGCYWGVQTSAISNFTGHIFSARIQSTISGSSSQTYIGMGVSGSNAVQLVDLGGTLTLRLNFSNVATTTYSSSTQLYWRLRESSGTVYADVSADGVTWSTPTGFSTIPGWAYTSGVYLTIGAGTSGATHSGYAQIDQVQLQ